MDTAAPTPCQAVSNYHEPALTVIVHVSAEPTEVCNELVVSFKTMCWNGRIVAVSNESNRIAAVFDDEDDDDDVPESSEPISHRVDLNESESSELEMELDTEEEDYNRHDAYYDSDGSVDELEESPSPQNDEEEIECEVVTMEFEMDIPIAEYASEEYVQTLPKPSVLCTNVDIDRCVGCLLATEYNRQRRVGILDKDSILDLQAKSCALEEFSSISNEVVVGGAGCSEVDRIPLNDSSVDKIRSTGVPKVSKHMLSFQASTTNTSQFTKSNTRFVVAIRSLWNGQIFNRQIYFRP